MSELIRDTTMGDLYTIRRYESGDREGFLALYERVFGGGSGAWFDWKYAENPYVDHVPVIVAETDGEVVGAKPAMAFRVRIGDDAYLALQPADTMVHPDHQRRGLYSRMLEFQKEYYAAHEAALFFNFPNDQSMKGSLEAGWRVVERVSISYRIQNPATFAFAGQRGLGRAGERAVTALTRAYLGVRYRLATPPDVHVTRHDELPRETLAELYRNDVPRGIHAVRDEAFFEWRFHNPNWDYRAYTARRRETPVAGVVVGTRQAANATVTYLTDVVPLVGNDVRSGALSALLERVVADHAEADMLAVRGRAIPTELLTRYGFHHDDSLPLSLVASPTTLVTRPADGADSWTVNGIDLLDPSNWSFSFSESDTA